MILMMSPKMASLGLPKIKVFRNKGHYIFICVHNVTNKILLCDSNNITDLVM